MQLHNSNYLLGEAEFHSLLLGRFQQRERGVLKDICDGQAYHDVMVEEGFLTDPMNISLTLNTDGVQISNSSDATLWPVYMAINELPPHLRYRINI